MFKFASNVFRMSHNIIEKFIENKEIAVDCTLGTGKDCDFLSTLFKKVIAFDVQEEATKEYKKRKPDNVEVILRSHEHIAEYVEKADCIIYNLGYLPGSNKTITTVPESTLKSINSAIKIINNSGIIIIAVYRGHYEGKLEEKCLNDYLSNLDPKIYSVFTGYFHNRSKDAPFIITIEKLNKNK